MITDSACEEITHFIDHTRVCGNGEGHPYVMSLISTQVANNDSLNVTLLANFYRIHYITFQNRNFYIVK